VKDFSYAALVHGSMYAAGCVAYIMFVQSVLSPLLGIAFLGGPYTVLIEPFLVCVAAFVAAWIGVGGAALGTIRYGALFGGIVFGAPLFVTLLTVEPSPRANALFFYLHGVHLMVGCASLGAIAGGAGAIGRRAYERAQAPQATRANRKWRRYSALVIIVLAPLPATGFRWLGLKLHLARLPEIEATFARYHPDVTYRNGDPVELSLRHSSLLANDDVAKLAGFTTLERLDLSGTDITGAALQHLAPLTKLEHLHLTFTKVDDAGLVYLKPLTRLKWLDLSWTEVTDAGLAHLEPLASLERLDLRSTAVRDDGLAYLERLTNLEELNLFGTQITDKAVRHLKRMGNLKSLWLSDTALTEQALNDLKAALPDTDLP